MNILSARVHLFLAASLLLVLLMPADARPFRGWNHDERVQKADLIVIATVRSTADAKGLDPVMTNPGNPGKVVVESVFDVQAVLKGGFKGRSLVIEHEQYANKKDEITVVDGPAFITFDPKKKSQYLIYLQKVGEHYRPLTGWYDPWQSFFRLQPYAWSRDAITAPPEK